MSVFFQIYFIYQKFIKHFVGPYENNLQLLERYNDHPLVIIYNIIFPGGLAANLDREVTELCKNQHFGLLCDESNDQGDDKDFVILARIYDEKEMAVRTRFLAMPTCNIGTGENLFNLLDETLR